MEGEGGAADPVGRVQGSGKGRKMNTLNKNKYAVNSFWIIEIMVKFNNLLWFS
jgi:hypothetical protein